MTSLAISCRCGETYHADPRQAGRAIRCRCGRTLAVRGGARSRTRSMTGDIVEWTAYAYLASAFAAVVTIWFLSERWWPATIVMFGPRWVLLLPALPIIGAAAVLRWRALVPALAGLLLALFPVMGLSTAWRTLIPGNVAGDTLRVVTFNVADRELVALDLDGILREFDADIVAFQECGRAFSPSVHRLAGWHISQTDWLCLLSRYPIREAAAMDRSGLAVTRRAGVGGAGAVVRHTLDVNGRDVHVTNLHLETARKGVHGLQAGDVGVMEANTGVRRIESRRARRFVDSLPGPQIVLGDFNTTVESPIYRESWGDMTNAFSHAGRGFGWTRGDRRIRVRIDHILTSRELRPIRSYVAPDRGSDHFPVVTDLVLLPPRDR